MGQITSSSFLIGISRLFFESANYGTWSPRNSYTNAYPLAGAFLAGRLGDGRTLGGPARAERSRDYRGSPSMTNSRSPRELNTLKQKSLVSSRISPQNIASPELQRLDFSEGVSLRLLEHMKSWPNPQFVLLKGSRGLRCDSSHLISILPASDCRPDLQDVVLPSAVYPISTSTPFELCVAACRSSWPIYMGLQTVAHC